VEGAPSLCKSLTGFEIENGGIGPGDLRMLFWQALARRLGS